VAERTQSAGRRAASDYLRQLLLKPGTYRQSWEQHVVRARSGAINQLAVAEVLARHLSGRSGGSNGSVLSHQLKDTVSRALSGQLLSRPSLGLFIDAFGFNGDEADRLWRLWSGAATIRVLSGSRAVPMQAEQELRQALGPRRHQTLTLHDHAYVEASGHIGKVRSLQVIEATQAGVDRLPFLYDTNSLTLELGQGCAGLAGELRQVGPDVYATEILLTRTLGLGETLTMEYTTTFAGAGDPQDKSRREYRRAVVAQLENLDLRIQFDEDKLPAELWWATWEGVDGEVVAQQQVALDSQNAAQRYLRTVQRAVVGFYWRW
jgi:hypothetical protein